MTNRQKVGWMVLCLASGACARLILQARSAQDFAFATDSALLAWFLVASPIVFLFSAIRIYFNPNVAYIAGIAGAMCALPLPLVIEQKSRAFTSSLWTMFNLAAEDAFYSAYVPWLMAMVTLSTFVLLLGLTRLLPQHWRPKGRPLRERTWPAVAITSLLIFAWYLASVSPYRVPLIVDGGHPDIAVLHVIKRGIRFEETRLSLNRYGGISKNQYSRRWFQYRFPTHASALRGSADLYPRMRRILDSPDIRADMPIEKLHSWNAEGWYVVGGKVMAFTTENRRPVPPELMSLFKEIDDLPAVQNGGGEVRDICFGFCYDPWAGLGAIYINNRCRWSPDGKTRTCL